MRQIIGSLACVVLAGGVVSGAQSGQKPSTARARTASTKGATPAIEAAFRKAYPDATIKHVSKEKENGREQYEVESIDHGKARDLIYLADGKMIEMEEELPAAELPAAVASAVKAKYPAATITKSEKLTITEGTVIQYELALRGAPVKSVTLTPEGHFVPAQP